MHVVTTYSAVVYVHSNRERSYCFLRWREWWRASNRGI